MKIINIKGNTFCIDTGMTYIPFYKISERDIIMLDSGWFRGERKGIDELIDKNNYKIKAIICTHFHIDHVGNCRYLKDKHKCIIAMPAYEALVCHSAINLKLYYSTQTLSDVMTHYGEAIFKTDVLLPTDSKDINIEGSEFKVLQLPGHSPSHIGLITPDDVVYLGDSLISYNVMKNAKMPYAYILLQDLQTKEKLYELKYNKYVIAHKGIYNDITKLITDNIEFYKGRAMGVYSVITNYMTMEDILKASVEKFKIDVKTSYKYNFMERMLRSYVEYLDEIGLIKLEIKEGFLKYCKVNKI